MKNSAQILCLVLIFSLLSCTQNSEKRSENLDNQTFEKKSSPQLESNPIDEPEFLIGIEDAKKQVDNYKIAHPGVVGDEYALRTWISIKDLKEYLTFVENSSKEKGIEISGIDFIHAQYQKAKPGLRNENNLDYNLTIMLAPTYYKDGKNIAFDPIHSSPQSPVSLSELFDKSIDEISTKGKKSSIANSLTSCPNQCE